MKKELIVNYLEALYPNAKCELIYHNNYELLISIILSAQTTDKKVNMVSEVLYKKYPDMASLALAILPDVISIIKPLGLANNKAKNIIQTAKTIMNDYNGIIPSTKEELLKLNGVGVKVAEVYLGDAYGMDYFPVDTHVFRLAHRLGISSSNDVVKVSQDLKEFFKGYPYMHLHHQMIFFGRYFCTARHPNCQNCQIKCSNSPFQLNNQTGEND